MIDGTTADNFIVNRGGYNCGHELIPVSEVRVPKEVREKVRSIQTETEYPQKSGIIGEKTDKKFAVSGALMLDPLLINTMAELVDAFKEKVSFTIYKKAFNNMLKNEEYEKKGDVYFMKNAVYNKTEAHSAEKLTKAGYFVVFPNQKQINEIKKLEADKSNRKNDIYIYHKRTYFQKKVDLKTINGGSSKAIQEQIISGSGQAPVLALDIQAGVSKNNLITALRNGWTKEIKSLLINWKGRWYEIDKDLLFSKSIYNYLNTKK
jgi:hypothetical protein